jgi:hypothetical protein
MNSRSARTGDPDPLDAAAEKGTVESAACDPGGEGGAPDAAEIAQLAHRYWVERGCQGGSPEEDWYRAEAELQARQSAAGDSAVEAAERANCAGAGS